LRALFASPTSAAIFLTVNGVLLLAVEHFRRGRRAPATGRGTATSGSPGWASARRSGSAPPRHWR